MNVKGQFSIIAALLVAVILIATVIVTYSAIRNSQIQDQPEILSAIDETNLAIKQILGFTVGYYGSVLKVTGNSSYARTLAINYLESGLVNIANMHPEWGASFKVSETELHTYWFTNASYSMGNLAVTYNLTGLGIDGITYETSCRLMVQIENSGSVNQTQMVITRDEGEPLINLGKRNFKFYRYTYTNSTWKLTTPSSEPVAFANGTYIIDIPSEIDPDSYLVQVEGPRGLIVVASSFSRYTCTLTWNSTLYSALQDATIVVEFLQNGTIKWLGQNLRLTTQAKPIPPIPVKAIHVNQTINGVNQEVPFQVEDWTSNYRIPLGLTNNASVFSGRTALLFLVNPNVSKVTTWWNGSDTTTQTPYAIHNPTTSPFKNDDPDNGTLTNGILTLDVTTSGSDFKIRSTVGNSENTARFMQINDEWSIYGADPAYVIHHGVVRDIIHQEAEWGSDSGGGGAKDCPNLYAHIVLTLPANATYYTYQLRLMFVESQQNRKISDLCLIQMQTTISKDKWGSDWSKTITENGTSAGYPTISNSTGFFYNLSGVWEHHWSELIENNHGFGVMTTTEQNLQLYVLDKIAGDKTGGMSILDSRSVSDQTVRIRVKPASLANVSFTHALDQAWCGAVVTFDGEKPIYPDMGGTTGLWIIVEYPPTITVTTES